MVLCWDAPSSAHRARVVGRLEPVKIPMLLDNDMWVILTSWRQSFSYNYIYNIIYIYMDYSSPLDFIGWDRVVLFNV